MADDAGKTEEPTPKKLRDARKEGQFPRTQDASTWAAIAGGAAMLPVTASQVHDHFLELMAFLPQIAADTTPNRALKVLEDVPMDILTSALPMCGAAALAALLATAAQGVHPSSKALKPKFNRMNPLQGVKRMFGPKAAWEGVKALIKVSFIGAVVWILGRNMIPELVASGALPLPSTVSRVQAGLMRIVWACVIAGVVIAVADYAYQRRSTMKQLKMSMHEIKQEHKQTEGDPQVKAQIRQKQMAMSRNRMMSQVPKADVVLVNPTHLAIALKYQPGAGAPRVVAKGAGATAQKIRDLARENRVPVVEDKPLARVLYRVCEVDEEIPSELYTAVARILAFVMQAGRPSKRDGAKRSPDTTPVPEVPSRAELRARRVREVREASEGQPGPRR